jgi:hypothetical protein
MRVTVTSILFFLGLASTILVQAAPQQQQMENSFQMNNVASNPNHLRVRLIFYFIVWEYLCLYESSSLKLDEFIFI